MGENSYAEFLNYVSHFLVSFHTPDWDLLERSCDQECVTVSRGFANLAFDKSLAKGGNNFLIRSCDESIRIELIFHSVGMLPPDPSAVGAQAEKK